MAKRLFGDLDEGWSELKYEEGWSKWAQAYKYTPSSRNHALQCCLRPHQYAIKFDSYEDFEAHYIKDHTRRCTECNKNFPRDHILELHIEENHDPMVEAKRARGDKTYRCFVEDCDKICRDPHKRSLHLIDKHKFPKKYDFEVVNPGIDGKSSLLRWKPRMRPQASGDPGLEGQSPDQINESPSSDRNAKSKTTNIHIKYQTGQDQENKAPVDRDMEIVMSKMSSLMFVPLSVRSGRGGVKGGLNR